MFDQPFAVIGVGVVESSAFCDSRMVSELVPRVGRAGVGHIIKRIVLAIFDLNNRQSSFSGNGENLRNLGRS